jgi:hypothetical protein
VNINFVIIIFIYRFVVFVRYISYFSLFVVLACHALYLCSKVIQLLLLQLQKYYQIFLWGGGWSESVS